MRHCGGEGSPHGIHACICMCTCMYVRALCLVAPSVVTGEPCAAHPLCASCLPTPHPTPTSQVDASQVNAHVTCAYASFLCRVSSSALISALIPALISAGCRLPVRRRRVEKARHTQGPCPATCPCTSFTPLHSRPHAPPTHADAACASRSGQVESIDLTTGNAVQRLHTP